MEVKESNRGSWLLTTVYASPQEPERKRLWDELQLMANEIRGEWMMVGDFNEIADPMEKKGGAKVDVNACRKFADWIQRCNLIDLGYIGTKFTWKGPQWEGLDRVFKRLDRALSNVEWRTRYPNAKVEVLVRSNSDHHPLLINLEPELINNRQMPFRFEAMWNLHPEFKGCVKENWNGNTDFHSSLFSLTNVLMRWNKDIFDNIHK
ncbi:uncharacterized protein [Arachis hypogaea]|uniref:uncharacterized protein n=1 Tax=Arachis hypogaea TaxID=3818 RepID=UPI000DED1E5D